MTINSDDPAYFGGYINENFGAVCDAFDLNRQEICALGRNSFEGAFMDETRRLEIIGELEGLEASAAFR